MYAAGEMVMRLVLTFGQALPSFAHMLDRVQMAIVQIVVQHPEDTTASGDKV